jgi:hypothetical protein
MFLLSLLSAQLVDPVSIETLSWMSGDWSCPIWGGTFEESWSFANGGTMQGTGRLIKDGNTTMMEFMAIEPDKDGRLVMWIIPSKISKPDLRSTPFTLSKGSASVAVWENANNDFPSKITYTSKSKNSMECVIEGKMGDKPAREVFNFTRAAAK